MALEATLYFFFCIFCLKTNLIKHSAIFYVFAKHSFFSLQYISPNLHQISYITGWTKNKVIWYINAFYCSWSANSWTYCTVATECTLHGNINFKWRCKIEDDAAVHDLFKINCGCESDSSLHKYYHIGLKYSTKIWMIVSHHLCSVASLLGTPS